MKYIEVVEAFQIPPEDNFDLVPFIEWAQKVGLEGFEVNLTNVVIEGTVKVFPGDWIVAYKQEMEYGDLLTHFKKMTHTYFQKVYREDYKLDCHPMHRISFSDATPQLIEIEKLSVEMNTKFKFFLEKAADKKGMSLLHFILDILQSEIINILHLKKENNYEYQEEENNGESN